MDNNNNNNTAPTRDVTQLWDVIVAFSVMAGNNKNTNNSKTQSTCDEDASRVGWALLLLLLSLLLMLLLWWLLLLLLSNLPNENKNTQPTRDAT
eukprot:2921157-Karenia_brevis.AAC.1